MSAFDTLYFLVELVFKIEVHEARDPHIELVNYRFDRNTATTIADVIIDRFPGSLAKLLPFTELIDAVPAESWREIEIVLRTETVKPAGVPPLSPSSTAREVIAHLVGLGSEENRQGMQRYGIRIDRALGISHGVQRDIAKKIKRNHERAFELWASGIMEAQFIASITADPKRFTKEDARRWAEKFDSWDIVDGVSDLFVETECWRELIDEFAEDDREFVRRTAFAMLCWASVHRKKEPDETFAGYLPLIERHAGDSRNFVKKAVNWALRTIGKRSMALHAPALALAEKLAASTDRTARWIGKDAARELTNAKTLARLARKAG
jgi:3-methyladenine DNA glycosylase AlkD